MLPVEVLPAPGGNLVLRARGSELLILTSHVVELRARKEPREFTQYFMGEALINRPARKLFEAWLRKDKGLWRRIYDTVQTKITDADIAAGEDAAGSTKADVQKAATVDSPKDKVEAPKPNKKTDSADKPAKVAKKSKEEEDEDKPKAKAAPKKSEAKPAKKEEKSPAKKAAPKKAAATKKPAAKPAAKAKPAKKK